MMRRKDHSELPRRTQKIFTKKVIIVIISIIIVAAILVILLLELAYLPFFKVLRQLSEINLALKSTSYNPFFNFTTVEFTNIGRETLYNITIVSELGETHSFPLEVKPGQVFRIGLKGKVSKVIVYYATEPNGNKKMVDFEWKW
jgi:magnesium-transporting ATPase (P-type)